MPLWLIILLSILAALLAILITWIIYEIYSRQRRKQNRKEFETNVYELEKDRAENALRALQAANIARAGAAINCHHGYLVGETSPTPPLPSASGGCPACYAAGYYQLPDHAQLSPHGSSPPAVASTQMVQYQYQQPQQSGAYYEPQQYGQITTPSGARTRLAYSDSEIPNSPPPVAPPGFVTVPMVIESV